MVRRSGHRSILVNDEIWNIGGCSVGQSNGLYPESWKFRNETQRTHHVHGFRKFGWCYWPELFLVNKDFCA